MRLIFPAPASADDLDDDALVARYAPDRSRQTVRVNFAASLDGAVEVGGFSEPLSGPADKRVFKILRQHCDALLVGAGTVRNEGYHAVTLDPARRAWREAHGLAPYPVPAIVSASLALDPRADILARAPVRPIVFTHDGAPADRRAALADVADVVSCGVATVDLGVALAQLRSRGLPHVLSEGGPHLFGGLVAADLVDELCLTYSPQLAGAGAERIVAGPVPAAPLGMRLVHALFAEDSLITMYARAR
ncbi:pyrimidine reductase family protein [Luedemannella helvata]|uniref:Bifunctional diaminohydroxyphosphoribosylaminopyrimidine deaminase/5-amino-6-(5-phosphoribosylamino)uracil reductase n=1 Tax=Luedemannella helvata TaxID=349315 RepID=A0ABN2L4W9_9ACTN